MSAQQNLVPNGSFEDTVHCPTGADIYNAKFFSSPTDGTPDYFNLCTPTALNVSVPVNAFGYQLPKTGNAYAGIVCYTFGVDYREYIQTPLISTLEKGRFYLIEYYIALGNFSPVACNNLGACFAQTTVSVSTILPLNLATSLSSKAIITDTSQWTKVRFLYTASGVENYLIIGNFLTDNQTDTLSNVGQGSDQYYYIDDISVKEFAFDFPNVFTPNGDNINDLFHFDVDLVRPLELSIYNRWGLCVYRTLDQFKWNGINEQGIECNAGIYYYIIKTETGIFTGFLELIR